MRKFSLLLVATGVFSLSTFAQEGESYNDKYSTWSAGLDVGLNLFTGDLRGFYPESDVDGHNLGFGASLYLNKSLNHLVTFSGSLGYNSLTGKNKSTYFTSNEFQGALDAQVNITSLISKGGAETRWAWMPFVGIGMSMSEPGVYDVNDVQTGLIRDDMYLELISRVGLLAKYRMNNSWDLDFRFTRNYFLNSDWSDGTSGSSNADVISAVRVGVTYNFGASDDKGSIIWANPLNDMAATVNELDDKVTALSTDSDGDGVSDYMDADNETPEGYVVDGKGNALDTDRDGIADDIDQDPFSPRGAQVDATGRELDDDGDGIPNSRDEEPNTPEGKMVNFQGRTITGGMGGDMANAFMPDVFFGFNSATVTSANEQRLLTIAKIMMANEDIKFEVIGHADPVGSEKYNMNLSERRAQAVVDVLVNNFGISEDRFKVTGAGEGSQVGNNNNINRRVEFNVMD